MWNHIVWAPPAFRCKSPYFTHCILLLGSPSVTYCWILWILLLSPFSSDTLICIWSFCILTALVGLLSSEPHPYNLPNLGPIIITSLNYLLFPQMWPLLSFASRPLYVFALLKMWLHSLPNSFSSFRTQWYDISSKEPSWIPQGWDRLASYTLSQSLVLLLAHTYCTGLLLPFCLTVSPTRSEQFETRNFILWSFYPQHLVQCWAHRKFSIHCTAVNYNNTTVIKVDNISNATLLLSLFPFYRWGNEAQTN